MSEPGGGAPDPAGLQLRHIELHRHLDRLHQLLLLSVTLHAVLFATAAALAADGFFLRWLLLIPAAGVLVGVVGLVAGRAHAGLAEQARRQLGADSSLGDETGPSRWTDPSRLPALLGAALTVGWVLVAVLMVGSLEWW